MINRAKKFLKEKLRKIYYSQRFNKKKTVIHNAPVIPEQTADLQFFIDFISRGKVSDCLKIEGWLYSPAQPFNLIVELDDSVIAVSKPDFVRQDVCSAFPEMEQDQNTGFKLNIPIAKEQFSQRGASQIKLFYVDDERKSLLATSMIFHIDNYAQVTPAANTAFYFTVASSNISLGGFGDFKQKLLPFAIGHCQLGFMAPVLYMRSTLGAQQDWRFDPCFDERKTQANGKLVIADSLQSILNYSIEHQTPCVIGLNGGIWGDASGSCPEWDLTDHLEETVENCQWNQNNEVMPDDYLDSLSGAEQNPELSRALTLNHYNNTVRTYKKRNLQQAAQYIVDFAKQYPQLYIGSNLDPDCYHNPFFAGEQWYDFNPQTIEQFRDWLAGTGVYQNELKHCVQHTVFSLAQVNSYLGTSYQQWSELEPPRHLHCTPCDKADEKILLLWEHFKRHLVHRHYIDLSDWLVAVGLPERMIFSSQGFTSPRGPIDPFALKLDSPLKNYDSGGMSLQGSKPEQGHVGAILYGESARNTINTENRLPFFQNIKNLDPDWAVVEFNPADLRDHAQALPSYGYAWDCLREMFNHGARFVNLMAWNGSSGNDISKEHFNAHMALRDTPLEHAVIDFMLLHADVSRGEQSYTFGTRHYASRDGWDCQRGKIKSSIQGLHLELRDGRIDLFAPQPYLYGQAQSIKIEFIGVVTHELAITLVMNGAEIECSVHAEQQDSNGVSLYKLVPGVLLPTNIAQLTISVATAKAVKTLQLHRVVFAR